MFPEPLQHDVHRWINPWGMSVEPSLFYGGVFILVVFFFSFFSFFFFSFCVGFFSAFGFLASWLLGFLASWLLGFLAFCWFMRLLFAFCLFASSAFPVPLQVYAAFRWFMRLFAGLCGFGRLLAALAFRILRAFWILLPASSASPPPYLNHHFFRHHGGPLWGAVAVDFLQRLNCTPV